MSGSHPSVVICFLCNIKLQGAFSCEDACAVNSSLRRLRFHELEQKRSARLSDDPARISIEPAAVRSDAKIQYVRSIDQSSKEPAEYGTIGFYM
jgi:hypothetical protein